MDINRLSYITNPPVSELLMVIQYTDKESYICFYIIIFEANLHVNDKLSEWRRCCHSYCCTFRLWLSFQQHLITLFLGRKHCVLNVHASFHKVKMVINPFVLENSADLWFGALSFISWPQVTCWLRLPLHENLKNIYEYRLIICKNWQFN